MMGMFLSMMSGALRQNARQLLPICQAMGQPLLHQGIKGGSRLTRARVPSTFNQRKLYKIGGNGFVFKPCFQPVFSSRSYNTDSRVVSVLSAREGGRTNRNSKHIYLYAFFLATLSLSLLFRKQARLEASESGDFRAVYLAVEALALQSGDSMKLDGIQRCFESYLTKIKREAEGNNQIKGYSCFICFNFDEENIRNWVAKYLMVDLERTGLQVWCSRKIPYGGNIPFFQQKIYSTNNVVLVCSEEGQQKVLERLERHEWKGIAAEIQTLLNSFESQSTPEGSRKASSVFPIYAKGANRAKSCLLPLFLGNKSVVNMLENPSNPCEVLDSRPAEYYTQALGLYGVIRGLSHDESQRMQEEFVQEASAILKNEIFLDREAIAEWKKGSKRLEQMKSNLKTMEKPLITCLPPPKSFTGRLAELDDLHQKCQANPRVAITGLGGMGKTALALKYAEKYQSHYQFIHYIYGGNPQLIMDGFLKLADDLHIPESNAKDRLEWLKQRLDRLEYDYLIIVDGVDDVQSFHELESLLPDRGKCLLVTSRMPLRAKNLDFEVLDLTPLKREEAIDYLVKNTKDSDRVQAAILAEKLGALPLALKHAAAYMFESGMSFQKYLESFKECELKLFEDNRLTLAKGEKTILTTWTISLNAIEKDDNCTIAKDILNFFSFLGQTPIPIKLIEAWFKKYFPGHSDLELTDAIRSLRSYSMIGNPILDAYDVHPLVQKVTRFQLTPSKQEEILQKGVETFCDLTEGVDLETLQDRRALDPLIPHIEKLIERIPKTTPPQNSFIKLLNIVWGYHYQDGRYKISKSTAKILLKQYPERTIDRGGALIKLGMSLNEMGRHEEALKYGMEALELRQELLGEKHLDVATSKNNVGEILKALGRRNEEALEYFMKALELRQELLGENHLDVAESMNNVGVTFAALNRNEEALDCHKKVLKLRKELLGEQHSYVALSKNNIGATLVAIGEKNEEALEYLMEALRLNKELLGEKHPHVAKSLMNVGRTFEKLEKPKEALDYLIQSFKLSCEVFQESHPLHKTILTNTISCLKNQTNPELIQNTKDEILPLAIEKLGADHPLVESLQKI